MTFMRDHVEYLDQDEIAVWRAVRKLTKAGRAGNNSQIARDTGLPATRVAKITRYVHARSYLTDTSRNGGSYHWRTTGKTARSYREQPEYATEQAEVIYPS